MQKERSRFWVFIRHMQQHWRESLIIFAVLLSGFLFYTFYGSWSEAAASPEEVDLPALELPADVMLEIDHWAAQGEEPYLSPVQFISERRMQQMVEAHELHQRIPSVYHPPTPGPSELIDESIEGISASVMTSRGTVKMWGLSEMTEQFAGEVPLVEGRWPENVSEVVVHQELATRMQASTGEEIQAMASAPFEDSVSGSVLQVVGVYGSEHDIQPDLIVSFDTASEIMGASRSNLLLLWEQEVSPVEVEEMQQTRVFEMPQLTDIMADVRWGTRAPTVSSYPDTQGLDAIAADVGKLLPYGMLVRGHVYIDGEEEGMGLGGMYAGLGARLAPATLMIFLSQAVALTVILAIVVVDRQQTFGSYKVLGLSAAHIWRMYFVQVLLIGVSAGAVGVLLLHLFLASFGDLLGFTLRIQGISIALWSTAVLAMAVWCAHLASSLFENTDIDSMLRETYNFDWWSLVRMKSWRMD